MNERKKKFENIESIMTASTGLSIEEVTALKNRMRAEGKSAREFAEEIRRLALANIDANGVSAELQEAMMKNFEIRKQAIADLLGVNSKGGSA